MGTLPCTIILICKPKENETVRLFGFGYNSNGELGVGKSDSETKYTPIKIPFDKDKIVGLFCGNFHVQILVENDKGIRRLVGWGGSYQGRINTLNNCQEEKFYEPVEGCSDLIVKFLSNFIEEVVWNPKTHRYFSKNSQLRVIIYYLTLKRLKLKVPRFINYIIISHFVS